VAATPPLQPTEGDTAPLARLCRLRDRDAFVAVGGGPAAAAAGAAAFRLSEEKKRIPWIYLPVGVEDGSELRCRQTAAENDPGGALPRSMPDLAVVDPRLLSWAGPKETADTGLLALARGAEAFVRAFENPYCTAYAAAAVQLAVNHLQEALAGAHAARGRTAVASASVMAAVAGQASAAEEILCAATALAERAEAGAGAFAGLLLPFFLAGVLQQNPLPVGALLLPAAGQDRYAEASIRLRPGLAVRRLADAYHRLSARRPGLFPRTLATAGISAAALPSIAEAAGKAGSGPSPAHFTALLKAAWENRLTHMNQEAGSNDPTRLL
ncbi:MAG: iron-containing alcohol dehydrogenase, partial [Desulfobacterales bacterium]|nr:iron-containing alcohol dehydrogenase [Desulfobacterales bacterium]